MTALCILNYPWKLLNGKMKISKMKKFIKKNQTDLFHIVEQHLFENTPQFVLVDDDHLLKKCYAMTIFKTGQPDQSEIRLSMFYANSAVTQHTRYQYLKHVAFFAMTIVHEIGHFKFHCFAPDKKIEGSPSKKKYSPPKKIFGEAGKFLEIEIYGHIVELEMNGSEIDTSGTVAFEDEYYEYVLSDDPQPLCYISSENIRAKWEKQRTEEFILNSHRQCGSINEEWDDYVRTMGITAYMDQMASSNKR
eukprot:TRINITY_DN3449_c0_g1_i2.p1 TRINITY_DN3449_c0_g1~~TRINITY_DN3449_c0_g1_i2.p1  ORF type:complete len:248 (+),score=47.26 TRINITY_DN3449_c0_g1_i2:683-1426(+)